MTHEEIAKLHALAVLLDEWPTRDKTAVGYSGDKVAIVDSVVKDYAVYVLEPVTL